MDKCSIRGYIVHEHFCCDKCKYHVHQYGKLDLCLRKQNNIKNYDESKSI